MPRNAETKWIKDIKGYSDTFNVGDPPTLTNSLNNVKIKHGSVSGRGGMTRYPLVQAASDDPVIGIFNYRQADGSHVLMRMQPTSVEALIAGVWTDITGTALTGTVLSRPAHALVDDSGAGDAISLLFTNGKDLPRYWAGSGNTQAIASGTSPYGKGVFYYLGYVFLTNVSSDGTFTDEFDGHRMGRFSDVWNTSWGACTPDFIVLDETPGSWDASVVLGRTVVACKSDGFVLLRHTTTTGARFTQELMTDKVGIASALSLQKIDEGTAICLGTDNTFLQISPTAIKPISYDTLNKLMRPAITAQRLQLSRSAVKHNEKTYYFFYDRTGLESQLLDSYIALHYGGTEWSKGELGKKVVAAETYKETDQSPEALAVSTSDNFVVEFDSSASNDDGAKIIREWQTGWQRLQEEGWVHGARMLFERSARGRVTVDIAFNFGPFRAAQTFHLKGGSPSDEIVEVIYKMPSPVLCKFSNVRLRFLHLTEGATTELQQIGLETISILKTAETPAVGAAA